MLKEKSVVRKSGRPPGALNKKNRAVLEQAAKEGITQLQVQLKNIRRWYRLALALERRAAALSEQSREAMLERAEDFRQRAQEYAVAAAPFVHRRLPPVSAHRRRRADCCSLAFINLTNGGRSTL